MNTQKPVWKVFLLFLGPMMLANILQSLSGTLNNIFLGQMIGVGALAAASAFFPVMLFLISFVMGLGSGASVLIGQAWGAKKPERVQAVAGTTLSVGIIGGLIVAIFGGSFAAALLRASPRRRTSWRTPPPTPGSCSSQCRASSCSCSLRRSCGV